MQFVSGNPVNSYAVTRHLLPRSGGYALEATRDLEKQVGQIKQETLTPSSAAVENAASEFETLFANLLLKEMRKTLEPETLFGKDPGDVYGGLFDMFLGQAVAQAGGLGVGDMVRSYLETQPK